MLKSGVGDRFDSDRGLRLINTGASFGGFQHNLELAPLLFFSFCERCFGEVCRNLVKITINQAILIPFLLPSRLKDPLLPTP